VHDSVPAFKRRVFIVIREVIYLIDSEFNKDEILLKKYFVLSRKKLADI
jgi:hypothetical protein